MTGRLPKAVAVLSMFTGVAWAQDIGPGARCSSSQMATAMGS